MFQRILLCHDGSHASWGALQQGAELAVLLKAQVYVLYIVPLYPLDPEILAAALGHASVVDSNGNRRRLLEQSVAHLEARGLKAQGFLAQGNTIEVIVEYSRRCAIDLVVVGHYPRPTGGRWWSVTEKGSLAERLSCSVLIAVGAAPDGP